MPVDIFKDSGIEPAETAAVPVDIFKDAGLETSTPAPTPAPIKAPTVGEHAANIGLSALGGAISTTELPGQIASMIPKGIEKPLGAAIPALGALGTLGEKWNIQAEKGKVAAEELKPEAIKQEAARPIVTKDEAGNLKFSAPNLTQIESGVAGALPQIPQMIVGGQLTAAKLLGQFPKIGEKIATMAGMGTSNAAIASGQQYADTYDKAFIENKKAGMSDADAAAKAQSEAHVATGLALPVNFLTGLGLGTGMTMTGNLPSRLAKSVAVNAPTGALQGAVTPATQNIAMGKELSVEEIGTGGVMGAVTGTAMGSVAPFAGGKTQAAVEQAPEVFKPTELPSPTQPTPTAEQPIELHTEHAKQVREVQDYVDKEVSKKTTMSAINKSEEVPTLKTAAQLDMEQGANSQYARLIGRGMDHKNALMSVEDSVDAGTHYTVGKSGTGFDNGDVLMKNGPELELPQIIKVKDAQGNETTKFAKDEDGKLIFTKRKMTHREQNLQTAIDLAKNNPNDSVVLLTGDIKNVGGSNEYLGGKEGADQKYLRPIGKIITDAAKESNGNSLFNNHGGDEIDGLVVLKGKDTKATVENIKKTIQSRADKHAAETTFTDKEGNKRPLSEMPNPKGGPAGVGLHIGLLDLHEEMAKFRASEGRDLTITDLVGIMDEKVQEQKNILKAQYKEAKNVTSKTGETGHPRPHGEPPASSIENVGAKPQTEVGAGERGLAGSKISTAANEPANKRIGEPELKSLEENPNPLNDARLKLIEDNYGKIKTDAGKKQFSDWWNGLKDKQKQLILPKVIKQKLDEAMNIAKAPEVVMKPTKAKTIQKEIPAPHERVFEQVKEDSRKVFSDPLIPVKKGEDINQLLEKANREGLNHISEAIYHPEVAEKFKTMNATIEKKGISKEYSIGDSLRKSIGIATKMKKSPVAAEDYYKTIEPKGDNLDAPLNGDLALFLHNQDSQTIKEFIDNYAAELENAPTVEDRQVNAFVDSPTDIYNKAMKKTLSSKGIQFDKGAAYYNISKDSYKPYFSNGSRELAFRLPELVEFFESVGGKGQVKIIDALKMKDKNARGYYNSKTGDIVLVNNIFKDIENGHPNLAAMVFAHEIGHMIDHLPDEAMHQRGGVLGQVASLIKFTKDTMPESVFDEETHEGFSRKEKDSFRNEAEKVAKAEMKGKTFESDIEKKKAFSEAKKKAYRDIVTQKANEKGWITKYQIEDELKSLSREWKPFDETADPEYTAYRYSRQELYADAMSVLFNYPRLLQSKAPNFYNAFFNHLESKPEIKAKYEELQNRLYDKDELNKVLKERQRESFGTKEPFVRKKPVEVSAFNKLKDALFDKASALHDLEKQFEKATGEKIPPNLKASLKYQRVAFIPGEIDIYTKTIWREVLGKIGDDDKAVADLSIVLFNNRVIHERSELANPFGTTPEAAQGVLDSLKKELGEDKYNDLQEAAKKFAEVRQERVIKVLKESGMYTPELMKKLEENHAYALFSVIKKVKEDAGITEEGEESNSKVEETLGLKNLGKIRKQVGTLQKVSNTFLATMVNDGMLIDAARKNQCSEAIIKTLAPQFPEQFKKLTSENYTKDKYHQPLEHKDKDEWGILSYMENGKRVDYYVPKRIAAIHDIAPTMVKDAAHALSWLSTPMRSIFVSHNPLFIIYNAPRDILTFSKNMPKANRLVALEYSTKAAAKTAAYLAGEHVPEFDKMASMGALLSTRAFGVSDVTPETLTEQALVRMGQKPENYDKSTVEILQKMYAGGKWNKPSKEDMKKLAGKVGDALGYLGDFSEKNIKLAGYLYLKDKFPDMPEEQIAAHIRDDAGTPNFMQKGTWTPVTNNLFLFSNVNLQGLRASVKAFQRNPADYMFKTMLYDILPVTGMILASAGTFNFMAPELQDAMEKIPEYDKQNFTIIPIPPFIDKVNNKAIYLKLSRDFSGQMIAGLIWKTSIIAHDAAHGGLNMVPRDVGQTITSIVNQLPGSGGSSLLPEISVLGDIYLYSQGVNPPDTYFGGSAVPDKDWKAGGMDSLLAFAKYEAGQLGINSFYKFPDNKPHQTQSLVDKIAQTPVLGPAMSRVVKESDKGTLEIARKAQDIQAMATGHQNKVVTNAINEDTSKLFNMNITPREGDALRLYNKLNKEGKIPEGMTPAKFQAQYMNAVLGGQGNPWEKSISYAYSNSSKIAILQAAKDRLTPEEYHQLVAHLRAIHKISNTLQVP